MRISYLVSQCHIHTSLHVTANKTNTDCQHTVRTTAYVARTEWNFQVVLLSAQYTHNSIHPFIHSFRLIFAVIN